MKELRDALDKRRQRFVNLTIMLGDDGKTKVMEEEGKPDDEMAPGMEEKDEDPAEKEMIHDQMNDDDEKDEMAGVTKSEGEDKDLADIMKGVGDQEMDAIKDKRGKMSLVEKAKMMAMEKLRK